MSICSDLPLFRIAPTYPTYHNIQFLITRISRACRDIMDTIRIW